MDLLGHITTRQSIRKYDDKDVDDLLRKHILEFAAQTERLRPELGITVEIADAGRMRTMGGGRAPYALSLFSDEGSCRLVNAGFIGQQLDLYLASRGLGACWLAGAKPTGAERDGHDFVIALGFGWPRGKLQRAPEAIRRKPLAAISAGSDPRIEYARLAPSARNMQNWFFEAAPSGDAIHVFRRQMGAVMERLWARLNYIDCGIAMCHLWLASRALDLPFRFRVLFGPAAPAREGYEYICTV
ncbi:MAG: hypothetical protein LBS17_02225 [Actinomycetes bacterium]|jgi:nitroreductase|nr:hypothetical protein [Actinomycetes bacterium]